MKLLSLKELEPLTQADPNQEIYVSASYHKSFYKIPRLQKFKIALELTGDKKYDHFLDIGFGSGIFLPELANRSKNLTAIDVHDHVDLVKKVIDSRNISANLIKANILNMPFADNSFDGILCLGVLQYVKDTPKAIKEIKRVAKPGAKIIIGIPILNWLTKLCLKLVDHSDPNKIDGKIIIKHAQNNLQIKKIKKYSKFLPLNLSLYLILDATKS